MNTNNISKLCNAFYFLTDDNSVFFIFRFPSDGSEPIPKPKDIPRIEAYDFVVEPNDSQQLEEILADPDAMRMQALVIRERILGGFFITRYYRLVSACTFVCVGFQFADLNTSGTFPPEHNSFFYPIQVHPPIQV